jgi:hypothetical protein
MMVLEQHHKRAKKETARLLKAQTLEITHHCTCILLSKMSYKPSFNSKMLKETPFHDCKNIQEFRDTLNLTHSMLDHNYLQATYMKNTFTQNL